MPPAGARLPLLCADFPPRCPASLGASSLLLATPPPPGSGGLVPQQGWSQCLSSGSEMLTATSCLGGSQCCHTEGLPRGVTVRARAPEGPCRHCSPAQMPSYRVSAHFPKTLSSPPGLGPDEQLGLPLDGAAFPTRDFIAHLSSTASEWSRPPRPKRQTGCPQRSCQPYPNT